MAIIAQSFNYLKVFSSNLCDCGCEMTTKKTEHDIFVYCDSCFESFGILRNHDGCCDLPDRQLALRETSTHVQLVTQCKSCGDANGNSMSQKGIDISGVSYIDREFEFKLKVLRHENYEKVSKEFRDRFAGYYQARLELVDEDISGKDYYAYLQSKKWKDKRLRVLERDNYTCQSCGTAKANSVHHITYEHIYEEPLFELVSVCNPCHDKLHRKNRHEYRKEQKLLYQKLLT